MKIPLNQTYQEEQTLIDYPEIKELKQEYEKFCLEEAKWHKYGRSYDCALSLHQLDFKDKVVAELGARDSIFSSYLTKMAKKVHVSDTFLGWGDLGDLKYWTELWKKFSPHPERLFCEFQDMTRLSYPDEYFDIVVSFSAIEHIPDFGDVTAAKEMARVCKTGGHIVIGTEIKEGETVWASGSYFYSEKDMIKRLIESSGCELVGDSDFSYERSDKTSFSGIDFTSCTFCLQKV
jgi:SAM-dependent methyltransferase